MKTKSITLVLSILLALFSCKQNNKNDNKELVANPEGKQKDTFLTFQKEQTIEDNCNCPENDYAGTKADTVFKFTNGKKIALCGYRNPGSNPIDFSEFVLSVCGENKIIDSWDGTQTCRLKINKDTLIIENVVNLPVEQDRKFKIIVWEIEKLFFKNKNVIKSLSINKNIRTYNQNEIAETLKEYENSKGQLNDKKMELVNRLFISTISGNKTAGKYFKEFKTKFGEIDGAFSEEYNQLNSMLEQWIKKE